MRIRRLVIPAVAIAVAAAGWYLYSHRQSSPAAAKPVTLRLQSFALSLHPLKIADVESRQVATLLHAGLVTQDIDGKVLPMLANDWSKDGNTYNFRLRPSIKFSNGASITAQDVVASLCAAMQPTSPWAWALLSIEHSDAPDGKSRTCKGLSAGEGGSVRITESSPVPWLLDAIGGPAGWVLPAQGANESAYGVMPGAGPYSVREIVPDVRVVLEARTEGIAVQPGAPAVQFDFLPNDTVAAQRFAQGQLDVLDLTSPQLVGLVLEPDSRKMKFPGTIAEKAWDRVRIVIVNERALLGKGFSPQQASSFLAAFDTTVDRDRLVSAAAGTAQALRAPFPPAAGSAGKVTRAAPGPSTVFPDAKLTIITESDAYSDLIAATLPRRVGAVSIDYRGVDKGILLKSLFGGEYDLASILIEATVKSPAFWSAFFTPGNPYAVLGRPIEGMDAVNLASRAGVEKAGELVAVNGNWVGLLAERRLQAIAPGISGITYSPSGQTNFAFIRKDSAGK